MWKCSIAHCLKVLHVYFSVRVSLHAAVISACVVHVSFVESRGARPTLLHVNLLFAFVLWLSAEQLIQSWLHGDNEQATHAASDPSLPPPSTFNPASDHRLHWWVPGVLRMAVILSVYGGTVLHVDTRH